MKWHKLLTKKLTLEQSNMDCNLKPYMRLTVGINGMKIGIFLTSAFVNFEGGEDFASCEFEH